jgi:hypothetical protein
MSALSIFIGRAPVYSSLRGDVRRRLIALRRAFPSSRFS